MPKNETNIVKPSYEDILVKWEDSKEWFMLWLSEVCGLSVDECRAVDTIIHNNSDVIKYANDYFDGDFDNIRDTLDLYKNNFVCGNTY